MGKEAELQGRPAVIHDPLAFSFELIVVVPDRLLYRHERPP